MSECKPFVKWVGGKSQLIKDIEKGIPIEFLKSKDATYIEPFVGGGAVLFWMLQNHLNIKKAVINDINPVLTNAYSVIKNSANHLIDFLEQIENKYYSLNTEDDKKEYFLQQRDNFNLNTSLDVEKAGLFIFLNRTCFNGLYRVNKKGLFNVPFGRYAKPKICDKETILTDSKALQKVEILTGDFSETLNYANSNSFFYFDPPYKPISTSSSFTTYTKEDFDDSDQKRLADFCQQVSNLNASFILSNSDVKNTNPNDNFFDDLFRNFSIARVYASRMINSKASGRGKISEILVSNM